MYLSRIDISHLVLRFLFLRSLHFNAVAFNFFFFGLILLLLVLPFVGCTLLLVVVFSLLFLRGHFHFLFIHIYKPNNTKCRYCRQMQDISIVFNRIKLFTLIKIYRRATKTAICHDGIFVFVYEPFCFLLIFNQNGNKIAREQITKHILELIALKFSSFYTALYR